ncbi:MAG TPA: UDP-glucose 4-epimerase GalE [Bryobacterales bacterium]|jgi:UDP-glucose 4-epimerase|nr:UDP-glucose 4-epimerase GalE [Bryobacterales bacterium]
MAAGSVLVTGGAGYIGSVAAERLLERGEPVVVLDNLSRGFEDAVPRGARFIEGDIADRGLLRSLFREHSVRAVMHFAAFALVGESVQTPEIYYRNNVIGSLTLIEEARAAGVERFILSSTCAVYGDRNTGPLAETMPRAPVNPYGETKMAIERALEWIHAASGWPYFALRYFNACGATAGHGERHNPETHLIPHVLRAAAGEAESVSILGADYPTPDGTCIRDYIHVEDLADAHICALHAPAETSGAYNVATGRGYSVREVIEAARRLTGRPIREKICPRRPGDPPMLVADASKIQKTFGWRARHDLDSALRSAWAFQMRQQAIRS